MAHLKPRDTRPARLAALSVLPVFLNLQRQRAVVAGGGKALAWKAELLAAAGASVIAYAPEPCAELAALAADPPAGKVQIIARSWQSTDLAGAVIAVGALDSSEAQAFAAAARAEGVPVNIVDMPAASTFSFGTIVNRSPVVVGISTSGAAPVLAQAIRAKIEALLHPALSAWARAARRLRSTLNARSAMGRARRDAWRCFADRALAARGAPWSDELASLARAKLVSMGSVVLVGAGPGDPELLTLKALRSLQSADVILYDRLVPPEILELARREAHRMLVGKTGGGPSCRQDDICALMVKLAREGQRVVRLKGGDPMVFGRAGEEIDACLAAGIPVEVVPGITAALGAAAQLLTPLTDRRYAHRLHLVSGHTKQGAPPDQDWASLTDPRSTTVFYMGARAFPGTLQHLLDSGLDPDTPAVVIVSATTTRSVQVCCRAHELARAVAGVQASEPCLIMIGRSLGPRCDSRRGSAILPCLPTDGQAEIELGKAQGDPIAHSGTIDSVSDPRQVENLVAGVAATFTEPRLA
jgi:uroporphyrin-III C-methyltransferase/precorrin-2 dehydrogenase/sirohydrochlorin ferrochelatase